jgi:predicted enzyme related to lactoylglutathione lyase
MISFPIFQIRRSVFLCVKGFLMALLLLLALISCNPRADFHQDYRPFFHKIAGTWVLEDGKTFELWRINPDSSFSGVSYYAEAKDTSIMERLRIVEEGNKIYYEAMVEGQNNGEPIRFELVVSSRNEIIFTNPRHDFPQKIHYTACGTDRMKAVVSGKMDGKYKSLEINYLKYMNNKKVTGIGGIFFKCDDPDKMRNWYGENLGLATNEYGSMFEFRLSDRPEEVGYLQWSPFPKNTDYFEPSVKDFMINFRVENIEDLVEELKKSGVSVLDTIVTYDYGKFVHIMDPEGNKIELWEPRENASTGL